MSSVSLGTTFIVPPTAAAKPDEKALDINDVLEKQGRHSRGSRAVRDGN
jgi:hypothetical protein